jgi:hypothetical protein
MFVIDYNSSSLNSHSSRNRLVLNIADKRLDFVVVVTPVKAVDNAAPPHELQKNHLCMSAVCEGLRASRKQMIGDGLQHVQTEYFPDVQGMSPEDVVKLQTVLGRC